MVYAKQAKNRGLEVDAAEVRMRVERRLGEIIKAQKDTVGLAKPGPKIATNKVARYLPTLADVGVSHNLSSRAQKLTAVPDVNLKGCLAVGEYASPGA